MYYAFKSVVSALIIMTMFFMGYAFRHLNDGKAKDLLVYFMGIYLLSGIAIWI